MDEDLPDQVCEGNAYSLPVNISVLASAIGSQQLRREGAILAAWPIMLS
jgi:hypothetical protein